jgi:hypothetical protein
MKQNLFTIVNAVGCLVLLVIVSLQWQQSEQQRKAYRDIQMKEHAANQARVEAVTRADALMLDLTELKQSLMETQKTADAAGLLHQQKLEELGTTKAAYDQATAERDALKKRITEWEAALKLRDQTITEQNASIIALRKKLDEAVAQLKKAGAK